MATSTSECPGSPDMTKQPFQSIVRSYTLTTVPNPASNCFSTLNLFCKILFTLRQSAKFRHSQTLITLKAFNMHPQQQMLDFEHPAQASFNYITLYSLSFLLSFFNFLTGFHDVTVFWLCKLLFFVFIDSCLLYLLTTVFCQLYFALCILLTTCAGSTSASSTFFF